MTAPGRLAGWTLRRRVRALFGLAAGVALVSIVLGVGGFVRLLDARRDVVDRLDPALQSADAYFSALVGQQNALRGLLLTDSPTFLDAYEQAGERADAAAATLAERLPDRDLGTRLQSLIDRAERWRVEFAGAELASRDSGQPVPPSVVEASREEFESIRLEVASLQDAVRERREAAADRLDETTRVLVIALSGSVIALIGVAVAIRVALRRWVTDPLVDLGHEAGEVTAGRLDRPIEASGPLEIRRLGEAVEAMRARIQRELSEVEEARALLVESSEELARSNRDLEQFAYVASHDLQEPLRKVTAFCQLLQNRYEGQLDERADQYIGFAVDGAKRMQNLINDLLAFSRVGRLAGSFSMIDLAQVLDRALDNVSEAIDEAGATIERSELPTVEGDANLLVAVFQNLIGNAVKFRRRDVAPVVRVSATRRRDAWELAVADNGIGVAPEYAERVFVLFQRLHAKDVYAGTGIGLALCRRIIEHHGGEIWLDGSGEVGTTVRFTLPDQPPTDQEDAP